MVMKWSPVDPSNSPKFHSMTGKSTMERKRSSMLTSCSEEEEEDDDKDESSLMVEKSPDDEIRRRFSALSRASVAGPLVDLVPEIFLRESFLVGRLESMAGEKMLRIVVY